MNWCFNLGKYRTENNLELSEEHLIAETQYITFVGVVSFTLGVILGSWNAIYQLLW